MSRGSFANASGAEEDDGVDVEAVIMFDGAGVEIVMVLDTILSLGHEKAEGVLEPEAEELWLRLTLEV